MKKSLFIGLIVFCCAFAKACTSTTAAFQEYVSHQVKADETVYSISKKYNVEEKEIFILNPDARKSVYEGLVLILPSGAKENNPAAVEVDQEDLKFKTHKVRRKETLYSISKNYSVPQDVIKRYNKQLYSSPLRKGDKIKIPTNYRETSTTVVANGGGVSPNNTPTDGNPYESYKVQPKETKYGVAQRYGITIAELEAMNPGMGKGLQMGTTINVPRKKPSSTEVIDKTEFDFYEVPQGDTMYSLLRRLEMNADALVNLNPALVDGLKEGMVLKIPKAKGGIVISNDIEIASSEKGDFIDLRDSISFTSSKKMVVMLPFGLSRMNGESTMTKSKLLKSDRVLRLALDFHSGILMAVEQAKKKEGITVVLSVYDTDYNRKNGAAVNARKIDDIISRNNFDDVDVVIGPLLKANVNRASSLLSKKGIPLIALSSGIEMRNTTFQTRPSDAILRDRMLDYLRTNGQGKNIVIIADAKNSGNKSKLMSVFPSAKTVTPRSSDSGYYLYPDDIPKQISDTQENWVILETNDIPLISDVTTKLNTMVGKNVTLFTTDRGSAYDSDEIQHIHLMNLKFHFPSFSKEIISEATLSFDDAYEDMFDLSPSIIATRGYDIAYDAILRLAYADDLFKAAATGVETQYIDHKFHYANEGSNGFYNDAVYLMRYSDDLQLEEVKTTTSLDFKD